MGRHTKSSNVLKFFKAVDDTGKLYKCQFSSCKESRPLAGGNPSNLFTHLDITHHATALAIAAVGKRPLDERAVAQLLADELRGHLTIDRMWAPMRKAKTETALRLLAWIVLDGQPFDVADSPRFRQLCASFGQSDLPSTRHLRRFLGLLHNGVDAMITSKLAQLEFVSGAVDEWSSRTLTCYLSVALQGYSENFDLIQCEDIIAFPPPHTSERYHEVVKGRIDYRVGSNTMLTSLCADGAAAGQKGCASIVGKRDTLWCLSHLLQLAVGDVIASPAHDFAHDIQCVHLWTVKIRSQIVLKDVFHTRQKECEHHIMELPEDVATRWDSKLRMIDAFLVLWPCVLRPMADSGVMDQAVAARDDIDDVMVERLHVLAEALRPFSDVTKLAGSHKHPVIALVPRWIMWIDGKLAEQPSDTVALARIKRLLCESLRRRTEELTATPSLYLMAASLIPSDCDLQYLKNPVIIPAVEKSLVEEILVANLEHKNSLGEVICATSRDEAITEVRKYKEFCRKNHDVIMATLNESTPWAEIMPLVAGWWRLHQKQFPLLARTAQALLAIQATSVSCERAFSDLGFLFSQRRRSMAATTLEAISLIRGNVPDAVSLDQLVEEVRRVALEQFNKGQTTKLDPFALDSD